jgi:hypothetical protein
MNFIAYSTIQPQPDGDVTSVMTHEPSPRTWWHTLRRSVYQPPGHIDSAKLRSSDAQNNPINYMRTDTHVWWGKTKDRHSIPASVAVGNGNAISVTKSRHPMISRRTVYKGGRTERVMKVWVDCGCGQLAYTLMSVSDYRRGVHNGCKSCSRARLHLGTLSSDKSEPYRIGNGEAY